MRRVDQLLDQYSDDHRNQTNQLIHLVCVPAEVIAATRAKYAEALWRLADIRFD